MPSDKPHSLVLHTLDHFSVTYAGTIDVCCVAPLIGNYKLDIDGAFLKYNQSGSLGGFSRDSRENWIIGFT